MARLMLLSVLIWQMPAFAAEPPNLVNNGDFSAISNGKPIDWAAAGDSASVTQELRAVKDANGRPVAQLTCTRCEPRGPAAHAMLAQVGGVSLVKGRSYEFACRIRAENLNGGVVSVAISDTKLWRNCGLDAQIPITDQWKTYRRVFRATESVGESSRLQIWFNEPGTLYVVDVRIAEVREQDVQFTDNVPDLGGKNLLYSGSFELGAVGWSSIGKGAGWGNLDRLHGRIETTGGRHGRSFLRIPMGPGHTPVLYFDYYEPIVRRELSPLAASIGWIELEKIQSYTLSCYMRATEDGVNAVIGVVEQNATGTPREQRNPVKLTKQWERYSFSFRPQARYAFVIVGPDLSEDRQVDVDVDAVQLETGTKVTTFAPRSDIEFGIEPAKPAGIFFDDEPAALILRASNFSDAAKKLTVNFAATDFDDQPAQIPDHALEIPAKSTVERKVKLPDDWRGYYRIAATADIAGHKETSLVRIAIVPRRGAGDTICGINHAFASADLIDIASKAGVSWYRDWSLKWQHIEPAKSEFHWDIGDRQIDRVLKEKASVLPLLPPFPSADWISEAPAGLPTSGYPGVRLKQAWGPKDPNELARYIESAVGRYKDRIHVWEFLNEPIYTDYSLPADASRRYGGKQYGPADYVRLLAVASAAMKKADPPCKVVGGIGGGPRQLTRQLIDAGILKHIDIFNLHMYPGIRAPETFAADMDDLLKLMDANGGRKPIWITEFSYCGADNLPRRPFFPSENSWSEQRLLESERQCADYTVRYFLVMLSRGPQKIFIHSGSSGRVNAPDYECALIDYGGAPRKLFPAMAVLTNLLGDSPKCVGQARLSQRGWCVAFETGQRSVLAIWQSEGARVETFKLPSGPEIMWMNAVGKKLTAAPMRLSTSPTYLIAPAGSAKALLASVSGEGIR